MNLKIIHERYLPRPARGAVAGNDYTNPTVRAAQGLITQQQRFFEVTGKWPKGYRPTAGDLEVVRADMEAGYHNHRVTNPSSNPGKQNLSPCRGDSVSSKNRNAGKNTKLTPQKLGNPRVPSTATQNPSSVVPTNSNLTKQPPQNNNQATQETEKHNTPAETGGAWEKLKNGNLAEFFKTTPGVVTGGALALAGLGGAFFLYKKLKARKEITRKDMDYAAEIDAGKEPVPPVDYSDKSTISGSEPGKKEEI